MIESVVDDILKRTPPAAGDNLSGFFTDADHAFAENPAFAEADVDKSGDPRSLLAIRATLSDGPQTVQEIAQTLAEIWKWLAYPHFEASAITSYREATVLRFVTVSGVGGYCVTGTATVSGPRYGELAAAYERDFGKDFGPLPTLAG